MIASAAEPPALRMVVPISEARICSEVTAPDGIVDSIVYSKSIGLGFGSGLMSLWIVDQTSLVLVNHTPARQQWA